MEIKFSELPTINDGKLIQHRFNATVSELFIDSRHPKLNKDSAFVAMEGTRNDGHLYIEELYKKGARNFIVEKPIYTAKLPEANLFLVKNSINFLQDISYHKRKAFQGEVIGITGSNGKTITKEWLFQMLSDYYYVHKSPRSYNSQIGVPLSLWGLENSQDMGIIEAGISQINEMQKLERIIKPTVGIFTNIGTAHAEGFESMEQKAGEKAQLFKDAKTIIFCKDYPEITHALYQLDGITHKELVAWSFEDNTSNYYIETEKRGDLTAIRVPFQDDFFIFEVELSDYASLENITHCILLMLQWSIPAKLIQKSLYGIQAIPMRLELKKAKNDCYIIDDSYNNDIAGLETALQFQAQQQQTEKRTLILSELLETGMKDEELRNTIIELIKQHHLDEIFLVGDFFQLNAQFFRKEFPSVKLFNKTEELILHLEENEPQHQNILIKGARQYHFEEIVQRLSLRVHETKLEINLNNLSHNFNYYKSLLKPATKMMVMVKAAAYGSGLEEISNWLQFHKADYLAVAYTDEGVALRENGINIPIMVMNPSESGFEKCIKYQLQPEIYSQKLLNDYIKYSRGRESRIHLKIDTGMHRLGFESGDINELTKKLTENPHIKIESIFSHLAAADEAKHNGFSARQVMKFQEASFAIIDAIKYRPLLHILNSSGIGRFPDYQYDMVRLGIGLYGVDGTDIHQNRLESVLALKTVISQIKEVNTGESVGYSRSTILDKPTKIATIAIGYADGLSRQLSGGTGSVYVRGKTAKIIGNVCMDMCMIDVTELDCKEGDEVVVFENIAQLKILANKLNTIPYEILTGIDSRVKRVFFRD